MKRKTKIIISAFAIISFVIIGLIIYGRIFLLGTIEGTPSIERLESSSDIKFPQGTRLIKGHFGGFPDTQYIALLEFDAKDTEAFIGRLPHGKHAYDQTRISRKDRLGITNAMNRFENQDWWDPDSVHRFVAVNVSVWFETYLLISLDDAAKTRVYLYIITT